MTAKVDAVFSKSPLFSMRTKHAQQIGLNIQTMLLPHAVIESE